MNRWRCVRCSSTYLARLDELPPPSCVARQTWALCGGEEFLKVGEETVEAPADCGVAAQASLPTSGQAPRP